MAGKFVGVDWYNGDYGVFEKHGEKFIPVKFSTEIYDCINYVCSNYDHLDNIIIPDTIAEIAAMVAASESVLENVA